MTDSVLVVDVQNALGDDDNEKPPSAARLKNWARIAYSQVSTTPSELTLRLVDEAEMVELNANYRGKDGSTNVLSFPVENEFDFIAGAQAEGEVMPALLGDIVICHAVIRREASEQNKAPDNHYAHMVTHGVLHLCGYDHIDDTSAHQMESLEAKILAHSCIENPYT